MSTDCLPTIPVVIETPPQIPAYRRTGLYLRLPQEIIMHILSFVPPSNQSTFASACKVSRAWYHASVAHLYARPRLTTTNYEKFISVICPTVTNIKYSPLAELIKTLDLSKLLYDGKASYTARLLRRTANNLENFIAPQTQFGISCVLALAKCFKLRTLDLRLVSHAMSADDLFQHLADLQELRSLSLPRSMILPTLDNVRVPVEEYKLPRKLEYWSLTGSVSDTFLTKLNAPESLSELRISHLSFARYPSIKNLLNRLSTQLKTLEINFHISTLPHNAMDKVLVMCPNLVKLCIAVDFVSPRLFDEDNTPPNHPLKQLDLDSSGYIGAEHKLKADDIYICLAEGRLPQLRILRISERLHWLTRDEQGVNDLVEVLESRKADDQELAGVWEF
ncbi:hypothetical protein BDZ91DRAFT_654554 [Kalaharituber pfeilii]|nr:hypothetical protein BDZ91DRAFT_654554 [Kalaharituber pfeilii]